MSNTQTSPMRSAAGGRTNGWARIQQILRKLLLSEYFVLYLSIIYFLVLWPFIPRIASPQNLGNIFSNMWPLLAVAIGQTFVLIVAGIDLSQSAIIALVSVIGAAIMTTQLDPVLFEKSPLWGIFVSETGSPLAGSWLALPVALAVMLGVGALIGLWNGTTVAKLKTPPFMVTLVGMMFSARPPFISQNQKTSSTCRTHISPLGRGRFLLSRIPSSWSERSPSPPSGS